MPNSKLLQFILESRKRGFDDWQIKEPLLKGGWKEELVNEAFIYISKKAKQKNKSLVKNAVTIYLDDDLVKTIDKRAKKNMMNFNEQVEDILRRSCLNIKKKSSTSDNDLDDKFIGLFSRKNTGRPRKL
jgi:hypothetical protein